MNITIKPLRERKKCIPSMVDYFVDRLNLEYGRNVHGVSSEALRTLMAYDWPGNVRELRNAIERAMMLEQGKVLSVEHFCQENRTETSKDSLCGCGCSAPVSSGIMLPPEGISIEEVEKEYIKQALARYGGNQTKAAKSLGLSLDTLRYRRKKFSLENFPTPKTAALSPSTLGEPMLTSTRAVPG